MYTTERALAEHGAKLSDAERRAVEQALNDAREALKADDMERIRRAQESLTRVSATLAEARRRENLEMDLPLWPWQAVPGASVRVETPMGR